MSSESFDSTRILFSNATTSIDTGAIYYDFVTLNFVGTTSFGGDVSVDLASFQETVSLEISQEMTVTFEADGDSYYFDVALNASLNDLSFQELESLEIFEAGYYEDMDLFHSSGEKIGIIRLYHNDGNLEVYDFDGNQVVLLLFSQLKRPTSCLLKGHDVFYWHVDNLFPIMQSCLGINSCSVLILNSFYRSKYENDQFV